MDAINKTRTNMLRMISLIMMSLFFVPIANAKSNLVFSDWDSNGDALISRSEFVDRFTENYVNDWDIINDDHLDDEDFFNASFTIWDDDSDEQLSEQEWLYGYDYFYGDYVSDEFVSVDVDGDGFIEYTEYYDVLSPTTIYTDWDVDGDNYLNEYELARMVFNNWDYDNSNFIEIDEYNDFDFYYLDI